MQGAPGQGPAAGPEPQSSCGRGEGKCPEKEELSDWVGEEEQPVYTEHEANGKNRAIIP